ncbi:cytochrome b5-like [Pararge aegeria]|uniref:cytochrome b5-like n=1 Tax=Pararge aegeria TaxID=116150 RepID=UPI0019D160E5|nr:cytochrome b5-like [Pararge aegeria]
MHAEPQWSWQELPFICDPEAGIRGLQNFARYADKSQLDQKLLTWEDVARCDGLHGSPLYVVFDNSVYDVTEFADFMAAVQKYTTADVASRNGKGGGPVWMIYKDGVYDVTSYVPQHPAGDVMLEEAGADCTKAFDESDHSSDALTILQKYKIGEIVDEEKRYDANGKKIKRKKVVAAAPETSNRGCLRIITCGLIG